MAAVKDEIIEKVRRYIQLLLEAGLPVQRAYLYGSYSTGTNHEDSDIDVAIVAPHFSEKFSENIRLIAKISRRVDDRIETKGFDPDAFIDEHPLAWQIRHQGIPIQL
jgi:predicted nucleotidyltransferase